MAGPATEEEQESLKDYVDVQPARGGATSGTFGVHKSCYERASNTDMVFRQESSGNTVLEDDGGHGGLNNSV